MRKASNLPKWLVSGLGSAAILITGCLNPHTARDGGQFPLSSTYNSQPSAGKSAPKSSSKATARLSDELAASSVLAKNSSNSKVLSSTPVSTGVEATRSEPTATASLSDGPATSGSTTTPTRQSDPSSTALRPSLPSSSPDAPSTPASSPIPSAVQPASAIGPLPATSENPTETSGAVTPTAPLTPSDDQPAGSKLSDFVQPNRLAPRPAAGEIANTDSGTSPSASAENSNAADDAARVEASESAEGEAFSENDRDQAEDHSDDATRPATLNSIDSSQNVQANLELDSEGSADAPWQGHLDRGITALEQQLAVSELDERERTRLEGILRLMYIAANRPDDVTASLDRLPSEHQEFWKQGAAGFLVLLSPDGPPVAGRQAKRALQHLRDACHQLAALASLEVRSLAFCRRVESFGRYAPFEPYEFVPEQEVILYTEVNNFGMEKTPDGYETELLGSYQIFDEGGRPIGDYELPLDKQISRHIRTDYFLPYRLYLPKTLSEGTYTIQVTMQDRKGHKFGQTEPVEFRIRTE